MSIVHAASTAVAEARQVAEIAIASVQAAEAHVAGLIERHGAKSAEHAQIASERSQGVDAPDHGARLSVIHLDLADLDRLIAAGKAVVEAAKTEAQQAAVLLGHAERGMQNAVDEELLARLRPHATILAGLIDAAIVEMAAAAKRLGRNRLEWQPTQATLDKLTRLRLTNGAV